MNYLLHNVEDCDTIVIDQVNKRQRGLITKHCPNFEGA